MSFIKKSSSPTYFLIIMFLISVTNYLDRQVLSIVQEDIKDDLSLDDSQLGMLVLVFGLLHAIAAIPIGRIADKFSRKKVLAVCLSIWSGFTVLSGYVGSYFHLLVARSGVGFGEAGVTPTTYSMISDKFPINRRSTALAALGAGIPIGTMLSLIFGGAIADEFGWRTTFIIFGLPGLLLALLLIYTIQAPKRGEADNIKVVQQTSFWEGVKRLASTRSFTLVLLGAMSKALVTYSILAWLPSYYIRQFGLSKSEVGLTFGVVLGAVGLVSLFGSAWLADKLAQKDRRWYSWILAICCLVSTPFFIGGLLAETYTLSLIFIGCSTFFVQGTLAITNSLIQNTSTVQTRGVASAAKTTALSFVGYGVGGYVVGVLSDFFATENAAEGLRNSLLLISVGFLIAGVLFFFSSFTLRQDMESATLESEAS